MILFESMSEEVVYAGDVFACGDSRSSNIYIYILETCKMRKVFQRKGEINRIQLFLIAVCKQIAIFSYFFPCLSGLLQ